KVEELVGLTESQFKQIIMLPQGEFRKLLTSDTENKEAILRRLFQTERYQKMHQHMKEKIDRKKAKLDASKQRLSYYIESIENQIPKRETSAIYNDLQYESPSATQVIEALQEERASLEKENKEKYRDAKMLKDKFIELDTYEKDYNQVMLQTDFYKRYEKELQAADQANQIRPYEEQVHIRQKEQATNAEKLTHPEQVLQSAKQCYERAKA